MDDTKKYTGRGGWRGGGRPKKKKSDSKLTERIVLVCRPEEKLRAERDASKKQMSVSDYVLRVSGIRKSGE
jgi:hypothetical protein